MIGLMIALVLALVIFASIIIYLIVRVMGLENDFADQQDANHAKCIAHVAEYTSNRVVALAFRDAAARYGTVDEQMVLKKVGRERWTKDGPSLPALWMDYQADLLDKAHENTREEETA